MSEDYNVTLNLSKICRLCLSQEKDMLQIFDNVNNVQSPPLPVKIITCASIEVIAGDGLPELLCYKCAFHIDSWYGFKKQCQTSDATLREYISRSHSDSENTDVR
ncbi:hypothetical protein C0J52_09445 [Blattella germanica]|nr:hypothetical protein C0J52_09445 [Blattella germanica]